MPRMASMAGIGAQPMQRRGGVTSFWPSPSNSGCGISSSGLPVCCSLETPMQQSAPPVGPVSFHPSARNPPETFGCPTREQLVRNQVVEPSLVVRMLHA